MGLLSKVSAQGSPGNSEDEDDTGGFTDGDFDDSDEDKNGVNRSAEMAAALIPVNETINVNITHVEHEREHESNGVHLAETYGTSNGVAHTNGTRTDAKVELSRRDSNSGDQNTTIVDFIGKEHSHAEQRLAARRAARAEAREIRMRELERQQREHEDHADKAYDMYSETVGGTGRRAGAAAATTGVAARAPLHSPRRSSDTSDTIDDTFSLKDLRHELKEVEEKFRKAMILNAQLDNDKASLSYQLELLKDRIEDLQEQHAQLQREHKEKCSAHERLRREHAALQEELVQARNAIRARDAAIAAAGLALVEATLESAPELAAAAAAAGEPARGDVPPLALVSLQSHDMLQETEGTLDVRLQKLFSSKQQLESEVRRLKLQLNEEQDRAGRHNGTAHYDQYDEEMESVRRNCAEYKARAARAETEAAVLGASAARLEAQVTRLRARQDDRDAEEEQLKQDRRRLQREAREALNRVEELETENSHLTKRLDKLKNAKSALLKEL